MAWDDWCFEDPWESLDRSDHYSGYNPSYYSRRKQYPKDKTALKLAKSLRGLLNDKGIRTVELKQAASGSCYLQFKDSRIGQCRVGNHKEKGNLGYRWHIRSDIDEKYVEKNKGHNQFIYPSSDLEGLVTHIYNYRRKILDVEDSF